ncbi:MAG: hypothetical protein GY754_30055, partial [bacterium]|nr:hypothetical protein [bacterium]
IFLYASQMFFEDGTIIQSSEVNNNFSELYQKLTDLEAVKSNKPQIFRYLNYDDNDYTNTGWTALDYSLFTAEKKSETSRLKITWTDSYRTISPNSNGGVCGWELRIDSDSCSPQPLYHFQHDTGSNPSSNKSMTSTVVQICDGVPAGNLKLQVFGKRRDGDEDCLRGYGSGLFSGDPFPASIIIEEVE